MRFKTKPYKHQLAALKKSAGREYFAFPCEQGTGKSWIEINEIASLWGEGKLAAVLLLAPNGVHDNWVLREIPTHMPDWVNWQAALWHSNMGKKESKEFDKIFEFEGLRILAINWEALPTKRGFAVAQKFCETAGTLLIACDESQEIKNPSAQRTKALMKLKKYSNYRRILTGTPVTNSPFDLFSQYTFLSTDILGTTSYYAFKAQYAEMLEAGHGLVEHIQRKTGMRGVPQIVAKDTNGRPKYKNLDKLQELIEPHSFRVTKAECLDLPEKVYTQSYYELTPKQKKAYELAKEKARVVLDDGSESAMAKLAAIMKMSQICSGWFIVPGTKDVQRIEGDNPKNQLFKERVRNALECGNALIVWARFHEEIRDIVRILEDMEISCVQYHGKITKKSDRKSAIDAFNAGEALVFVGQQDAGGTGLTLNAADRVIYYSNTFSLTDRLQSEDRCHRIGQDKTVVYEDLIARGTIDEKIIDALRSKKKIADIINGDAILYN